MLPRLRFIAKEEKVKLTKDGEQALIRLSEGDMRLVLNILQVVLTDRKVTVSHETKF